MQLFCIKSFAPLFVASSTSKLASAWGPHPSIHHSTPEPEEPRTELASPPIYVNRAPELSYQVDKGSPGYKTWMLRKGVKWGFSAQNPSPLGEADTEAAEAPGQGCESRTVFASLCPSENGGSIC